MLVDGTHYQSVWLEGGTVKMINQTLLPHRFEIFSCPDHQRTARAITTMIVRGAGAIGSAAAFAVAQAALEAPEKEFQPYLEAAIETIRRTRPTAQTLFYSVDRVARRIREAAGPAEARKAALEEAERVAADDVAACRRIGELGAELIRDGTRVLTHCNAGWLAATDWGTALAPIYTAARQGKRLSVLVDETRPRCQGAHLTAWELQGEGLDYAVIADNAAGWFMRRGEVDLIIVGCDRLAANGDVANKIGTYTKAVLAARHGVPFYVAAQVSTVDRDCPSGEAIPIEERDADEVLTVTGREGNTVRKVTITPAGARARNPAFDVTPAELITGIITEKGIVRPAQVAALADSPR